MPWYLLKMQQKQKYLLFNKFGNSHFLQSINQSGENAYKKYIVTFPRVLQIHHFNSLRFNCESVIY